MFLDIIKKEPGFKALQDNSLEGEVSPWLTLRYSPPSLAGDTPATPPGQKKELEFIYKTQVLLSNHSDDRL